MGILFAGHAKLMVSLLQDIQASDQRSTMLQLVEKMKTKQKEIGWFVFSYF
jgi:ATP-dependent DNA helicase Q1